MNDFSIQMTPEKIALERMRVGINTYVSRHAVLEYSEDFLHDAFRVQLRSEVLAQKIDQRETSRTVSVTFDEPSSAWQMFKRNHAESWWLRWLVDRKPVRYVQHTKHRTIDITFEALHIYPDARIALPAETFGSPYVVHRIR